MTTQLTFSIRRSEPTYEELSDAIRRVEDLIVTVAKLKEATPFIEQRILHMGEETTNHPCDLLQEDIIPIRSALYAKYGIELHKHGRLMNHEYGDRDEE